MSTTTTGIEWTGRTWNPLRGCTAVSAGCTNCYAATLAARWNGPGQPYEGLTRRSGGRAVWTGKIQLVEKALTEPLTWRKPQRVFVNSMSDLFHEDVPDDFIARVFAVMALAPRHQFQVLTKRPERMAEWTNNILRRLDVRDCIADIMDVFAQGVAIHNPADADGWPLPNVWLGTSVEDQAAADARIPHLLRTPAAVRFLSCEPLLAEVDIEPYLWLQGPSTAGPWRDALGRRRGGSGRGGQAFSRLRAGDIGWVIAGGESGPHARPLHPDWARSLRDQCAEAGVPFFFKQWGEWLPDSQVQKDTPVWIQFTKAPFGGLKPDGTWTRGKWHRGLGECMYRVGKSRAGRLLDDTEHNGFPEASPCPAS